MSNIIEMSKDARTFYFQGKPVRVVDVKGQPWFVAADVCKALGIKNTTTGLNYLDKKERSKFNLGGGAIGNIINESGLYKIIMRSDKPAAKPFQNWVTQTVLPAIRKDGGYVMGEEKIATGELSEDEFILKAMTMLQNKAARLEAVVEEHLKFLTVSEWAALNHLYLSKGQRVRLGEAASYLCRQNGFEPERQKQKLSTFTGNENIYVGLYPKHILDDASLLLGMELELALNLGVAA